jgi:hypothetical protein
VAVAVRRPGLDGEEDPALPRGIEAVVEIGVGDVVLLRAAADAVPCPRRGGRGDVVVVLVAGAIELGGVLLVAPVAPILVDREHGSSGQEASQRRIRLAAGVDAEDEVAAVEGIRSPVVTGRE